MADGERLGGLPTGGPLWQIRGGCSGVATQRKNMASIDPHNPVDSGTIAGVFNVVFLLAMADS